MAITQYIGARYVPLFYTASDDSNNWESGVQYEPLTIVTYLNQSYTSKIPVPASVGNPADNPDYWIMTGAYSAQVDQLAQDVEDLDQEVQDLKDIMLYPQRHIAIICDSYGTYNGAGAGHEISYNILDRLLTYSGWDNDYIHYSAENGAGFCNGLYLSQLNSLNVADDVKPQVTDVYVIGGWNDENGREGVSQAAFNTAAAAFKTAALTKFPNARLHICFAAWSFQSSRTMVDIRTTRNWHFALSKTGWIIENNYQWILHNSSWLIGNNVHPNQDGVNALADALCQIITKGECHAFYQVTGTLANFTPNGTLPANASLNVTMEMNDGEVNVMFLPVRGGITLAETTQIACDGAHSIKIGDYAGPTIIKGYTNNVSATCSASITDGANTYTVPGSMSFVDGEIKFAPDYVFSGASYLTVNATKISIPRAFFSSRAW